jgi:dethiobiotin synthetase
LRGLFVTGTDTGAGKTAVAAAACAALRERGEAVAAWKPVVTGLDEPADPGWPHDHELLGAAAGMRPEEVSPLRFGPPVSPHLAAELAGTPIEPAALLATVPVRRTVIAEGVGGLLVPITPGYLVRDLALALELPVAIAARPGLGTINHTLLTVEAARAVGLRVAGVVMTPWPAKPSAIERSNRETVALLAGVEVATLPPLLRADPGLLAAAGAALPLQDWMG